MSRTHRYQHLRKRKDRTPVITESVSAGAPTKTVKTTAPKVRKTKVKDDDGDKDKVSE